MSLPFKPAGKYPAFIGFASLPRFAGLLYVLSTSLVGCSSATPPLAQTSPASRADEPKATATSHDVRVLIYSGPGAWPEGLAALRETFQADGFHVAETRGADVRFGAVDVLVVGGGWSPDQLKGFGAAGLQRVQRFVAAGGGYVGICAGAYLASAKVRWEGQTYDYPLGFFKGTAEGPRPGLVPWPNSGLVEVSRVEGSHPLQGSGKLLTLYYGGSAFLADANQGTALLRYPDGSLAALALPYGQGRVGLLGPHLEVRNAEHPLEASQNRELLRGLTRWAKGE